MRNHARKDQRQPEGKHNRPNCRGMEAVRPLHVLSGMAIAVLIVSLHHAIDSRPDLRTELLSPKYIHNQKHDDPHRIDKVPVKRQHFKAFRMHFAKPATHTEQERNRQEEKPNHDVRSVQTNQRVIGRSRSGSCPGSRCRRR
jgi:hypothetical protein